MRLYHQYYKILDEQIIPDKEFSDMILISCKISSSVVITIPAWSGLNKTHHQHQHHHLLTRGG